MSTLECARPSLAFHQSQVAVSQPLQFCALIKLASFLPAFRKHDYRPTLVCQYKENLQTTFVFFLRFLVKTAMGNTDEIMWMVYTGTLVATFLVNTSRVLQATELCQECLILLNNTAQEQVVESAYTSIYAMLFQAYRLLNNHTSAINCGRKLLQFLCGFEEGRITFQLAKLYKLQSQYKEAKGFYKKALSIMIETGDREGEVGCYGNLASVSETLGEYRKAEEYQRKALEIRKEIGDRKGEAASYGNLGTVYHSRCEYAKAEECLNNALAIQRQLGNKKGEAACYGNLGSVSQSLGEYRKAEEYQRKALEIRKEIGDRKGEAACCGNLGNVYHFRGECATAEEYLNNALTIQRQLGNKQGEAACYGNLGSVSQSLGDYRKAEEYQRKALAIRKEIGDREGEAASYGNLGTVYHSRCEYAKAEECLNNALAIQRQLGNKKGEAAYYGNLGSVSQSLGEYRKAEEYQRKALEIRKEIGDREGEAACCGNLGNVYHFRGECATAEEYLNNALTIQRQLGNKQGEAACYGNLGSASQSLGDYRKAEEYQRKALAIRKEIGDREGEAACYGNLGTLFRSLGKHPEAKRYHEMALDMSREISDISAEAEWHLQLAYDAILEGNVGLEDEIFANLFASVNKCEKMRSFLGRNDQFKISLIENRSKSYHLLTVTLFASGNEKDAVCVLELARARALADLISAQHSPQAQMSVNPPSWADIERILKKENNCSCLYISYLGQWMCLWVLKGNKPIHFRKINVNECFVNEGLERNSDQVFSEESFRSFHGLSQEQSEDRSLSFLKASDSTHEAAEEGSLAVYRPVEEEEEENLEPLPTLAERYKMIIAPVAEFLDQPELVIVPDRVLYKVPFAALMDESRNYLSEAYRIRIVPSLTTLGFIQDCPADYHSRTGALIVGDPDVRDVYYKGCLGELSRLPSAKEEAEMIGKLIRAEPLLRKEATKEAVLQKIHSVSLIHFAARGDAERGEIALAPKSSMKPGTATEKDYLLTMADISRVQLRAKLVVLSCCHSARGHVKAEGVVGIARAFLGSGARSVLVALWAIPDEATKKLMSRFYEHLVRGESASESLHQAIKWMRSNGYSDICEWAPFMLIGDNVTFDFGK